MVFRRIVVLQNMSPKTLEFLECPNFAPEGSHRRHILLDPYGRTEIPASIFYNMNTRALRGSTIQTFVDGVQVSNPFIPQTFIHYVKILFYAKDGFKGVTPELTDICRFHGFGCLGREYAGRPEKTIE